jgi:hypothetical protein
MMEKWLRARAKMAQDHFASQFPLSHPLSIEPASKGITAGSVSN